MAAHSQRSVSPLARGGAQPPGQPWPGADLEPPTYLWQSLLCLLLFLPTAVIALAYSAQVTRRLQLGDWRGAVRSSRLARTWCLLSVLGCCVVLALVAGGVLSVHAPAPH